MYYINAPHKNWYLNKIIHLVYVPYISLIYHLYTKCKTNLQKSVLRNVRQTVLQFVLRFLQKLYYILYCKFYLKGTENFRSKAKLHTRYLKITGNWEWLRGCFRTYSKEFLSIISTRRQIGNINLHMLYLKVFKNGWVATVNTQFEVIVFNLTYFYVKISKCMYGE